MGGSVSSFIGSVAKTVAKGATSALGGMIPVVGPALAGAVNSLYAKGGMVMRCEAGGVVPAGFKKMEVNTPAQLIRLVKQFPDAASKANLSVQDIKDAVAEMKGSAPAMARGGMSCCPGCGMSECRCMGRGGMMPARGRGGMSMMPGMRAARGRGGSIN